MSPTATGKVKHMQPESLRVIDAVNAGIPTQKIIDAINDLLEAETVVFKKVEGGKGEVIELAVPDRCMRRDGVRLAMDWRKFQADYQVGRPMERKQLAIAQVETPEQKARSFTASPAALSAAQDELRQLIAGMKATDEGRAILKEFTSVIPADK